MSLQRFHDAHKTHYATALNEMVAGVKRSHWIWYIFPQLDGLGQSSTAQFYAIRNFSDALAYLRDPLLREHYVEIGGIVAQQLSRGVSLVQLMGGAVDAAKLVSSITLFRAVARHLAPSDPGSDLITLVKSADIILQRAAAQGYPACEFTLGKCKL